jgi:HSP20 family protein
MRPKLRAPSAGSSGSERSYGSFYRTILLPEGVEDGKAEASFRNGVLEVTIPAQGRQQNESRRLEVKG